MNQERALALASLIREIREDDNGWIPDEAWSEIQKTFRLPYTEVAIWRRTAKGTYEILLQHRKDEHFEGWEIPGMLALGNGGRVEAAATTARKELGIEIKDIQEIGTFWWNDHPYGRPISHVCLAQADGEVTESETLRFFEKPTDHMVPHHGDFMRAALTYLETGARILR